VARTASTAVALEVGPRRTFASALEWPGWCRSGLGEAAALEALAAYRLRYGPVAARAGLGAPAATLAVVETVAGTAVTDFGAPDVATPLEQEPLDAAGTRRLVTLLDAAWDELAAVAATAPATLRRGPRGGGRDRDAMVGHVVDAERAYARKIGVALTAQEWRTGGPDLLRDRIRGALIASGDPGASAAWRWPPRYFVRRTAWHALDHAWEMQDRSG
jgi:hypothetical protein